VRTLASIKHATTLKHSSVSQSACVIIILMLVDRLRRGRDGSVEAEGRDDA
jgi:hypothetical protein